MFGGVSLLEAQMTLKNRKKQKKYTELDEDGGGCGIFTLPRGGGVKISLL